MTTKILPAYRGYEPRDEPYLASSWLAEAWAAQRYDVRKGIVMAWESVAFDGLVARVRAGQAKLELLTHSDVHVGWWAGELWDRWAIVDHMSVKPTFRRLGFGSQLLGRIKDWAGTRPLVYHSPTQPLLLKHFRRAAGGEWNYAPYLRGRLIPPEWYQLQIMTHDERIAASR